MLWVVSFNLCMGREPPSSHACSRVLRALFMCVMCSVMRARFCCFAGGIFSFMAFGGGVCPLLRRDSSASGAAVCAW